MTRLLFLGLFLLTLAASPPLRAVLPEEDGFGLEDLLDALEIRSITYNVRLAQPLYFQAFVRATEDGVEKSRQPFWRRADSRASTLRFSFVDDGRGLIRARGREGKQRGTVVIFRFDVLADGEAPRWIGGGYERMFIPPADLPDARGGVIRTGDDWHRERPFTASEITGRDVVVFQEEQVSRDKAHRQTRELVFRFQEQPFERQLN